MNLFYIYVHCFSIENIFSTLFFYFICIVMNELGREPKN